MKSKKNSRMIEELKREVALLKRTVKQLRFRNPELLYEANKVYHVRNGVIVESHPADGC